MISASQASSTSAAAVRAGRLEQRDVEEVAEAAEREPGERCRAAITSALTAGPAAARRSSARRLGLAARAGEAAERPQVDAVDLHPLAARDERVAELVGDDGAKNSSAPSDGDEERLRAVGEDLREVAVEHVDHDEQHQEPGPADPDADPEEPPELERVGAAHSSIVR